MKMKTRKINKMILGLVLVIMLVVGVGSIPANAQGKRVVRRPNRVIVYRSYNPYWYRYNPFYDPFWDPFYSSRFQVVDPIAYQTERGFSEGKHEGEEDAEKGRQANATGHKDYLKSDSMHFRKAFVQGYEAGYQEEIAELNEKARKRAAKLRDKHGD
jgi:hypothetical protein